MRALWLLFAALLAFLPFHSHRFEEARFNWFTLPEAREIYLLGYEKVALEKLELLIYSTSAFGCKASFCGSEREVELKPGENELMFGLEPCNFGRNSLELSCGDLLLRVSFSKERFAHLEEDLKFTIELGTFDGSLLLSVKGKSAVKTSGYWRLNLTQDFQPLHRFEAGVHDFVVEEKTPLRPEPRFDPLPILFLAAAVLLSLKLGRGFGARLLLVFVTYSLLLTLNFRLAHTLNLLDVFSPLLLFCLGLTKRRFELESGLEKEAFVVSACYVLLVSLLWAASENFDIWWPYYARHLELTAVKQTSLYWDDLSYLGRPFAYPPGFFEFGAQLLILGLSGKQLHPLLLFFYAFSLYLLFWRFERRFRLFAFLCCSSLTYALISSAACELRCFALALVFSSAILLSQGLSILAALSFGLSSASHYLPFLLFPICAYAALGKLNRDVLFVWLVGIAFSSIFYLPLFFNVGLPSVALPMEWGLMKVYGLAGAVLDLQFLNPLLILALTFSLTRGFLKSFVVLLFLLITYLWVSHTFNTPLIMMLAITCIDLFSRELGSNRFYTLILFLFFLNYTFSAVIYSGTGGSNWCGWGAANHMCLVPMEYLKRHVSTQENVFVHPRFGHLVTYFSQKRVLADSYVEYADEQKLRDALNFYETLELRLLEPYNISVVVLDDFGRERDIRGVDRIYDNGFIHVFRLDTQRGLRENTRSPTPRPSV